MARAFLPSAETSVSSTLGGGIVICLDLHQDRSNEPPVSIVDLSQALEELYRYNGAQL
jgi:hypothetical protein